MSGVDDKGGEARRGAGAGRAREAGRGGAEDVGGSDAQRPRRSPPEEVVSPPIDAVEKLKRLRSGLKRGFSSGHPAARRGPSDPDAGKPRSVSLFTELAQGSPFDGDEAEAAAPRSRRRTVEIDPAAPRARPSTAAGRSDFVKDLVEGAGVAASGEAGGETAAKGDSVAYRRSLTDRRVDAAQHDMFGPLALPKPISDGRPPLNEVYETSGSLTPSADGGDDEGEERMSPRRRRLRGAADDPAAPSAEPRMGARSGRDLGDRDLGDRDLGDDAARYAATRGRSVRRAPGDDAGGYGDDGFDAYDDRDYDARDAGHDEAFDEGRDAGAGRARGAPLSEEIYEPPQPRRRSFSRRARGDDAAEPPREDRERRGAPRRSAGSGSDADPEAEFEAAYRSRGRDAAVGETADPYDAPYDADAPFTDPDVDETRPGARRRNMRLDAAAVEQIAPPARAERKPAGGRSSSGRRSGSSKGRGGGRSAELAFRPSGPFSRLERMIAARYLQARRKEGFISVISMLSLIGITLGVATLIIVMSVMNGFRAELVERIVGIQGHLSIQSATARGIEDYGDVASSLAGIPGVTSATPLVTAPVFVTSRFGSTGAVVRGMRREDVQEIDGVGMRAANTPGPYPLGSLVQFTGEGGVAIGDGVANRLGVNVGDSISILSPNGNTTPFGVTPRRKSYEILSIFKLGVENYDNITIYMPIEEAQRFFNRITADGAPYADLVEVRVATPERLETYKADIVEDFGASVRIGDWQQENSQFIGALKTERTVMFLILTLLILIASLIIISGLIMLVKEKGGDIAILRTMGLSKAAVLRIFFMCGATIGTIGTSLGVLLGVVVTLNLQSIKAGVEGLFGIEVFPERVYQLPDLPARLHGEDVLLTVAIALGLSFIATLYPAWRAAKMDPIEALRYE